MSNFERIKEMTLDEMEEFLQDAEYRSPWAEEFAEACCKTCKPDMVMAEGYEKPLSLYQCDYDSMPCVDEDVLCTDGVYLWTDSVVQGKATGDGQVEYYLDSGNDISASRIWWTPKPKLPMTCENCKRFFAGAENAVGVCGKSGELVWRHAATCDELLER